MRSLIILPILLLMAATAFSQTYKSAGLRFATDFNYFHRADENDLTEGWFSTAEFGIFYRWFSPGRGVEMGFNINSKGGLNLPVIMEDYDDSGTQNVKHTALEFDLRVGPRFSGFHPKFGFIVSYRLIRQGYLDNGSDSEINKINLQMPFGASMNFKTGFGAIGFGGYYKLGLSNVLKNNSTQSSLGFNGGRQHSFNFEITVTYDSR